MIAGSYLILENNNQAAMESLTSEREARLNIERSQTSLSEELGRTQRELSSANQKVNRICLPVLPLYLWPLLCSSSIGLDTLLTV